MNKAKGRNKKFPSEQKLSFGSALKQNVIIINYFNNSSKIRVLPKKQKNLE